MLRDSESADKLRLGQSVQRRDSLRKRLMCAPKQRNYCENKNGEMARDAHAAQQLFDRKMRNIKVGMGWL